MIGFCRNPHEWQSASGLPQVRTDPVKLRMILKNLIDNAAKYTDEGTVRIASSRTRDMLRFEVSDTGPGIPPDGLETIFDAFHQLDTPGTAKRGGVGLGLHIVSRLVTALGGSIDVQSKVGSGTTFAVMLPFHEGSTAPNT